MGNKILLVNGPNLNMLGTREPDKYGRLTLNEIVENLSKISKENGFILKDFQSNHEGEIIDFLHREGASSKGLIINAGAYTHTSIAIRDAILSVSIPFVEVHLSNVYKREDFRKNSYLSDIAIGVISGFGYYVYELGFYALVNYLENNN
ncbi:MAG: type II 3-dehydroquinate dehydratase [Brevinematales bacterium]|nr:type II 3-dehydroquinate dehydratase [Brevinematales bacterium]